MLLLSGFVFCGHLHSCVYTIATSVRLMLMPMCALLQAMASLSGANFFNLSPRVTDGRYPGKAIGMLLHMVFKVARTMAPSVIYIDEVEKVFLSDKKKLREFGSQVCVVAD